MPDYYAYLKLKKHSGSSAIVDTIPLRVVSADVSVDKQIPDIPLPFGGLGTGESLNVALDLGMSRKSVSLQGFIVDTDIQRSHTKSGGNPVSLTFTAQEVAQLIASGVDSTGIARDQAIDELIILIPSKVDENYLAVSERSIPLTFKARGAALEKDNTNVALPSSFPTSSTSTGLTGYISNFSFSLSAETVEVNFSMTFNVASVFP